MEDDLAYQLINEAKGFILLTESPDISNFISSHQNPFQALFQIMHFGNRQHNRFQLIAEYLSASGEGLINSVTSSLGAETENKISIILNKI